MYACINPYMPSYHFIPPSQRQFGGLGYFGAFSFGMPYMNMSLFSFAGYNNPYMGVPYFGMSMYTPSYFPTFTPTYYGYNYGTGYNFNIQTNYNTPDLITRIEQRRADKPTYHTHHYDASSGKSKAEKNAQKLGPNFMAKVKEISQRLNCDYQDLIAVMISESGLNPQAVNIGSRATGLIQFMPSTAKAMGTTVQQIKKMSGEEQLVLVEKYLTDRKREAGFGKDHKLSAGELYALVFLPGRSNREVLCSKGERNKDGKKLRYYESNRGLDTNGDGKITKTELDNRIVSKRISDECFS